MYPKKGQKVTAVIPRRHGEVTITGVFTGRVFSDPGSPEEFTSEEIPEEEV